MVSAFLVELLPPISDTIYLLDFIDYDELKDAIKEERIDLTEEEINNHIKKLD